MTRSHSSLNQWMRDFATLQLRCRSNLRTIMYCDRGFKTNWYIPSRWSEGTGRPFKFPGAYLRLFREMTCRHLLRVLLKVTFIWIRHRHSKTSNFRIYQLFSIFAGWGEVSRATWDPSLLCHCFCQILYKQ